MKFTQIHGKDSSEGQHRQRVGSSTGSGGYVVFRFKCAAFNSNFPESETIQQGHTRTMSRCHVSESTQNLVEHMIYYDINFER